MTLKHVLLELARSHDFPSGSSAHGYDFVAPLSDDGKLLPEEWRRDGKACTVRRFWAGEDESHGHLVHTGKSWRFHYDDGDIDEDEPLFKLDRHSIRQGEYLSITEHDGTLRTFRVVRVSDLRPPS